jgi:hypothetical protein
MRCHSPFTIHHSQLKSAAHALPFTIQEFTIHHSIIHNSKNGGGGIHHSPFKNSQLKSAAHALPIDSAQSKQITSTA